MILNELFDRPLPITRPKLGSPYFEIGSYKYFIAFDAEFTNAGEDVGVRFLQFDKNSQAGQSIRYGATGTGNEFQVFSTVVQEIRDYLHTHDVCRLHFWSDLAEPSRIKMYDRLLSRMTPVGWKSSSHVDGDKKVYQMIKPQEAT